MVGIVVHRQGFINDAEDPAERRYTVVTWDLNLAHDAVGLSAAPATGSAVRIRADAG